MSPEVRSSTFRAAPHGVPTDEVGAITGDLEPRTSRAADGTVPVEVRYAGAEEWYTIPAAGGRLRDPASHEPPHAELLGVPHWPY